MGGDKKKKKKKKNRLGIVRSGKVLYSPRVAAKMSDCVLQKIREKKIKWATSLYLTR